MRTFIIIFILLNMGGFLMAQTPQKMSYQAVIRDGGGQLIKDRNIGMQISVLQGSESGTAVFVERFFPTTNTNGLVTVQIGGGLSVNGSFSGIDWSDGPYFVKTETDINGGANYSISATSQLLSIPYALMAKNVENVPSLKMDDLTDVDAVNIQAGQLLKWDGTNWKPANDATTGGPGTTYTPGSGISIDVNNVISNTGDLSNTNEIQQLEIAGNQLKLTGANTVTLPTGTTYTAGPGISLNNNTITNTGDNDNDADNELQQLTLSGTVLTLSQNGGSVTLPSIGGGGGDNWGTQNVETNPALAGNGTQANPLDIADGGVTPSKLSETGANHNDAFIFDANTNNWVLRKPVNIQEGNGIQVISTSNGPLNYVINAVDPSATNELQNLSLNGSNLTLSQNGGSVTLPDASATNELQTISLNGNTVSLSQNGGSFTLPNASPQTLSLSGANLSLSGGGGSVTLPDANSMNEIQVLSLSGANQGTLNLSNGGGSVNLPLHWSYLPGGTTLTNNSTDGLAVIGDIKPTITNSQDLGSFNKKWDNLYVKTLNSGSIIDPIFVDGDLYPIGGGYCGSGDHPWTVLLGNTVFCETLAPWGSIKRIGLSTNRWLDAYIEKLSIPVTIEGNFTPNSSLAFSLGTSTKIWDKIYVDEIGGAAYIDGNFRPSTDENRSLGISTNKWSVVHAKNGIIQTSDRRLKKNIAPVSYGLKDVMKIKPITWEWKNEKQPGTFMGFVAQDLLDVVPSAVYVPTEEDYKEYEEAKAAGKSPGEPSYGIKYTELIPVLTKAIQEQQVMIDQQNKTINALIKRIEMLENK